MNRVFVIPINPKGWTAPRLGKNNNVYSLHSDYKKKVRSFLKEQYDEEPYSKLVQIHFHFEFALPKTATNYQKKKMLAHELVPLKIDCTNMQKLFEDCLNNLVITDDRNVALVSSHKTYAEKGSVTIFISDYTDYLEFSQEAI